MPVDMAALAAHKEAIHKRYPGAVHPADDTPLVERVSTGSLELDYATGGGIPIGRWCRFYGDYMSCKSLCCWHIVREFQELGMNAAYYNVEQQFDKTLPQQLGVDTSAAALELVEGTTIEGIGEIMQTLMGSVHLHIIDSLSSAVSIDELNAGIDEWRPGLSARAWGKVFHNVGPFFDSEANTVIMVDQLRDAFSMGRKGNKSTRPEPPGGRYINHQSSMNLLFRRGRWLYKDADGRFHDESKKQADAETVSEAIEPDGMEVQVLCEKSRVGRPFRSARLHLDYADMTFDRFFEYAKAAEFYGLVEVKGTWYHYGGKKGQGQKWLRAEIAKSAELRIAIEKAVSAAW